MKCKTTAIKLLKLKLTDVFSHTHNTQCSQLQTLLSTLEQKCSSEQLSEEDRAEMLHVFCQAKEDIFGKNKSYCTYL